MPRLDQLAAGHELDHRLREPRVFLKLRRAQYPHTRQDREIRLGQARLAVVEGGLDGTHGTASKEIGTASPTSR
jgi:hypothetical protein